MTLRFPVPRALAALGALCLTPVAHAEPGELTLLAHIQLDRPTEIVAHDPASQSLFVTLGGTASLAVIDLRDPLRPRESIRYHFDDLGSAINSAACRDGLIAVALTASVTTDPGIVVFLGPDGRRLATVRVGAMPDMAAFTPDGQRLLVANEGEPSADGSIDPPGSVSIIELETYAHTLIPLGNPAATGPVTWTTPPDQTPPALIEPEYIAITPDSSTAYVVCQENNAVARISLGDRAATSWHWLGMSEIGSMTALRQPDGIVAFETPSGLRIVTANEGDPRDSWGSDGVTDHDGVEVAASSLSTSIGPIRFGTQSLSLYDDRMNLISDTADDLPTRIDAMRKSGALSGNAIDRIANRAGKRGAEPEGLAHWSHGDKHYIFAGLERAGMVAHYVCAPPYDSLTLLGLTQIPSPDPQGKLPGPEGLLVIDPPGDTGPILVVTDEVHGTLSLYSGIASE